MFCITSQQQPLTDFCTIKWKYYDTIHSSLDYEWTVFSGLCIALQTGFSKGKLVQCMPY